MAERGHRNSGVTATDVARRAGVSQSTVSRVLNPNGKVKVQEEARQRVLQAARELGYRPNAIAQTMISGRSKIVGVVVSDYFNVFYYQMLQLLTNRLMAAGLQAMVFSSPPRSDINELLQRFYRYQVDGVIVTSSRGGCRWCSSMDICRIWGSTLCRATSSAAVSLWRTTWWG